MKFTPEHDALRRTTKQFVDSQINPFVDEWEEAGIFPAHELFRKMAEAAWACAKCSWARSGSRFRPP